MLLSHLSLTHFRNYRRLELDFNQRLTLLQGRDAQGKTSLLEAIYFLATSKPIHASTNARWSIGLPKMNRFPIAASPRPSFSLA